MVESRKYFGSDYVSIGDLCDVIGGNDRGHRRFLKRFTALKVVIQLENRKNEITILQSNIAAVNRDVDIEDEVVNKGDCLQFVEGMYRGEAYVIKRHRWMIPVSHLKLARRVRVWPSSVR
jgi:hypothetical protein